MLWLPVAIAGMFAALSWPLHGASIALWFKPSHVEPRPRLPQVLKEADLECLRGNSAVRRNVWTGKPPAFGLENQTRAAMGLDAEIPGNELGALVASSKAVVSQRSSFSASPLVGLMRPRSHSQPLIPIGPQAGRVRHGANEDSSSWQGSSGTFFDPARGPNNRSARQSSS